MEYETHSIHSSTVCSLLKTDCLILLPHDLTQDIQGCLGENRTAERDQNAQLVPTSVWKCHQTRDEACEVMRAEFWLTARPGIMAEL